MAVAIVVKLVRAQVADDWVVPARQLDRQAEEPGGAMDGSRRAKESSFSRHDVVQLGICANLV